jgi:integrase/recombinase XerD
VAYQYVREPLRAEEADRLANACQTPEERLLVWTLLDTGLRVSELCALTGESIQWQQRSIRVEGKGAAPTGSARRTASFR